MSFTDKVLGVSGQALALRAQRMELISSNLANVDTPGYKAKDIDFQSALKAARGDNQGLRLTHENHMTASGGVAGRAVVQYVNPSQPSLDGNTVEAQREHAAFMDSAVRYQASIEILDGRLKSTIKAITGD